MIAHRLQTIMTAENLLFIEDQSKVIGAEKGTFEYKELLERLKQTNYAHQKKEEKERPIEQIQTLEVP